jgi:hypothetical protein
MLRQNYGLVFEGECRVRNLVGTFITWPETFPDMTDHRKRSHDLTFVRSGILFYKSSILFFTDYLSPEEACTGFDGEPEGNSHWGDPGVDGKIILRWIFKK